jgi:hypothetical protein
VPLAVKEASIKTLSSAHGLAIDHGLTQKEELKAQWAEFSEKYAPAWLLKIPVNDLPQALRRWVMETKKINQLLAEE